MTYFQVDSPNPSLPLWTQSDEGGETNQPHERHHDTSGKMSQWNKNAGKININLHTWTFPACLKFPPKSVWMKFAAIFTDERKI